ncbi:MAG TPA: hypothetical protein GX745_07040 [Clostridiales bacterium]|nr:hypothetical protein [Clostridiales bacterium]
MVEIKKTRTMIATLLDIKPPESNSTRFLRLQGRTGSLQYSERLEFIVLGEDGHIEDGFRTAVLVEEPKKEGRVITFKTKNSEYRFRELF